MIGRFEKHPELHPVPFPFPTGGTPSSLGETEPGRASRNPQLLADSAHLSSGILFSIRNTYAGVLSCRGESPYDPRGPSFLVSRCAGGAPCLRGEGAIRPESLLGLGVLTPGKTAV